MEDVCCILQLRSSFACARFQTHFGQFHMCTFSFKFSLFDFVWILIFSVSSYLPLLHYYVPRTDYLVVHAVVLILFSSRLVVLSIHWLRLVCNNI